MSHRSPAEWLGLALRSESDEPHEWPFLAWVIRNRVESDRFRSTYAGVITRAWQFSYFNDWTLSGHPPERIYEEALKGYAGDKSGWPDNDLEEAVECADYVINLPRWCAPFGTRVLHFWSPISMHPPGRIPTWANSMRIFSADGVDPQRWQFAEG